MEKYSGQIDTTGMTKEEILEEVDKLLLELEVRQRDRETEDFELAIARERARIAVGEAVASAELLVRRYG